MNTDGNEKCPVALSADDLCPARRRLKHDCDDNKGAAIPLLSFMEEIIEGPSMVCKIGNQYGKNKFAQLLKINS